MVVLPIVTAKVMMKRAFQVFLALIATGCCTVYSGAQQQTTQALSAYVDELHREGAFSGNILVADKGKVVLERAIGDADASGSVKLDLADRFQIGSIAKEFDSVGLLMLKEQGKLALTDPVSKFFPDLPSWASTITIDELLHYTSGLHKPDFNAVHSDAENWEAIKALQHLDFVPGTQYSYNNNDVFMRRRIIEKVSGMSFSTFVSTRELPAAGIRHAIIDPGDESPQVAKGLSPEGKQDKLVAPMSGWVALSLADFLEWSQCVQAFCLISPESTRLIAQTQSPDRQSGFGMLEMQGDTVLRHVHDGTLMHYRALLLTKTDKNLTILILGNQKTDVYSMAAALEALLDGSKAPQ